MSFADRQAGIRLERETAVARGRRAEDLAVVYLCHQGYRLVARNHRCSGGEVDVIAWEQDILCFVEIRARSNDQYGDPLETIDARKIRRVVCASRHFLEQSHDAWPQMRFDALGILLTEPPQFNLVRGAFEAA